jgi:O-antigen/teichoic acid export membrane protein
VTKTHLHIKNLSIIEGEFTRNVVTLVTGTAIAQAIVFAATPILTRIYTPNDFGVFAIYMAVVSILAALSSGRYELAIMLPVKDKDAINILALSVILSATISIMLFLIVIIYNKEIAVYLGNEQISTWLYLMPISVLFMGLYQSFSYWNNRKKQYVKISQSKVMQSGTTVTLNISSGLGKFFSGGGGLIVGGLMGQAAASVFLGLTISKKDSALFKDINRNKMLALGKKYKKFPIYDLPGYVAFTVYSNIAVIFFNKFFDSSVAGLYFLSNRLIQLPITLFSKSVSDVFYQKLSQQSDNESISEELNYYVLRIIKITIVPFLIITYTSFFYVEFIFGYEWKDLYKYITLLSIPAFFKLIFSPYTHVLKIINKQEVSAYLHLMRLALASVFFISYFYVDYSLIWFLFIYALMDAVLHLFLVFWVNFIIENSKKFMIIFISIIFILILFFVNIGVVNGLE